MNQSDMPTNRPNGWLVAVGVGVGSGLGAMVATRTGDWSWMPIVLAACIALGVLAASQTSR